MPGQLGEGPGRSAFEQLNELSRLLFRGEWPEFASGGFAGLVLDPGLGSELPLIPGRAASPSVRRVLMEARRGDLEAKYCVGWLCLAESWWIHPQRSWWTDELESFFDECVPAQLPQTLYWQSSEGQQKAAALWQSAAEQGHIKATYWLGLLCCAVPGVKHKGVGLIELAANQGGYAPAQYWHGCSLLFGHGVHENKDQAVELLRRSANQSCPEAQFQLGCMLRVGDSVPVDKESAAAMFDLASEQGHAAAQHQLACLCYFGEGVSEDKLRATALWQRAVESGYAIAQYVIGWAHVRGD